jgi:erythromycin esterase
MASHAVPLKSLVPGSAFGDLQPLKPVFKDVRVVGLGEGTHGTHEFMTVRHRVFEYLVNEMGFRVFAVEASYSGALKIDDYLQTGQGDPRTLLQGLLLWPFTTAEMLDLIKWMRTYNETAAPDQRLHYAGFDVLGGEEVYSRLAAFLGKVDPQYLEENGDFIRQIATLNLGSLPAYGQATRDQELTRLRSIRDHMIAKEKQYAAISSPAEARAAVLHIRNLVGTFDSYVGSTETESLLKRDRYMAEMIQGLLGQFGPEARMAIIAHNYHVSTVQNAMGWYLRELLGDAYYATELLFAQGSFRAKDSRFRIQNFTVSPATADLLEFQLACVGTGNAFLDYRRSVRTKTVQNWLEGAHNQRSIGAQYLPDWPQNVTSAVSPLKWDGLIYTLDTTPTAPIENL